MSWLDKLMVTAIVALFLWSYLRNVKSKATIGDLVTAALGVFFLVRALFHMWEALTP